MAIEPSILNSSIPEPTTQVTDNTLNEQLTTQQYGAPNLGLPELNPLPIPTSATEMTAEAEIDSARRLDEVKNSIQDTTAKLNIKAVTPTVQDQSPSIIDALARKDDTDKIDLIVPEISLEDTHKQLNDGSYQSKYDSYIHGVDNENRLAQQQSTLEKWGNGFGKFVSKSFLYTVDGTVGSAVGLVEGISQGNLHAVYGNDFSNWLDDLNTKLDYKLPNYYEKHERDMGFLNSMGTANFWANDALGGLAFTMGAIGSEAVWTTVTGGASLATSMARWSLKTGGKALGKELVEESAEALLKKGIKEGVETAVDETAKQTIKATIRQYLKNTKAILKKLDRTTKYSATGKALNNLRFMYTSSGHEAGFEAKSALDEAFDSYITSFRKVHGRDPNGAELAAYRDSAVDISNKVFAANVAIVGSSNIAQFGSYFGIGTGLSSSISKSSNRLFGIGINKTVKETGEVTRSAIKASTTQKILGNTWNFLESPLTEGVYEEGLQGVVSKASSNWLASRYNPDAINASYSSTEAVTDAFKETYGTKEGFKEIGLGMIIGLAGGAAKTTNGKFTPFQIGKYAADTQANEKVVELLNNSGSKFTEAQSRLLERLVTTGQFNTYINRANKSAQEGKFTETSLEWDTAQFTKMLIENNTDLLDESIADFNTVIDRTPNETLMKEYSLTEEQVVGFKEAIKQDYAANAQLFKKATAISEALAPSSDGLTDVSKSYAQELGLNIFLGVKSAQRAQGIAETIEELTGEEGAADAIAFYTNLQEETRKKGYDVYRLTKQIEQLEDEYATLRMAFTSTNPDKEVRREDNTENADKLNENEKRELELRTELANKRKELVELKRRNKNRLAPGAIAFGGTYNVLNPEVISDEGGTRADVISDTNLIESVEKLEALNTYIQSLEDTPGAESNANALKTLMLEYKKNVMAFRDFNIVYEQMADPKFAQKQYKGLTKILSKFGKDNGSSEYNEVNTILDERSAGIDKYIEDNKDTISESDIFTIRVLERLDKGYAFNTSVVDYKTRLDPITATEYREYKDSGEVPTRVLTDIADRIFNGLGLSARQNAIYKDHKTEIDEIVKERKLSTGDTILNKVPTTPYQHENTILGRLKQRVENIVNSTRYLEQFKVNDFNKKDLPTAQDFQDYEALLTKLHKYSLTPAEQEQLTALRDKINTYGSLQGTSSDVEGESLADLIEQIVALENLPEGTAPTIGGVFATQDIIDEELEVSGTLRNFEYVQSYDKAVVTRREDHYAIANISSQGIVDTLDSNGQVLGVTVKKTKSTKLKAKDGKWNVGKLEKGDSFTVKLRGRTGQDINIKFTIGDNGNITLIPQDVNTLNSESSLSFFTSFELGTSYQPLFQRIEINGEVSFRPINTDFTFEGESKQSTEAIHNLRKGEATTLEVSFNDEYNQSLLDKYEKAKGTDQEISVRQEVEDQLVIYVKDSQGNFLGVLKATSNKLSAPNDIAYTNLKALRVSALTQVETNLEGGSSVELTTKPKVAKTHIGHPNLIIKEEGRKKKITSIDFSERAKDKVTDIGYILNGNLVLRNDTKKVYQSPFTTKISKLEAYKDKKVPVIVTSYRNKNYAYPIQLKEQVYTEGGQIETIFHSAQPMQDRILQINNFLAEQGADMETYAVTSESMLESNMVSLEQVVADLNTYGNISDLIDGSLPISEALNLAQINIDLANNPFHSPKFSLDMKGINTDNFNTDNSSIVIDIDAVSAEVSDIKNEEC